MPEEIKPQNSTGMEPDGVRMWNCPDEGTCHHFCKTSCFRVNYCSPLSIAKFPNDEWPEGIKEAHTANETLIASLRTALEEARRNAIRRLWSDEFGIVPEALIEIRDANGNHLALWCQEELCNALAPNPSAE